MAATTQLSTTDGSELCVLCTEKHSRTRPSFCQCKHCSSPLCLDCIKEHHDELLQNVSQISHQYNELQQLMQTKQMMITDETAKSIDDVNRYFDTYIDQLRDTQKKIIANMESEKQNAQDYVGKIDVDLRFIGGEIQGLVKESVVQTIKMNTMSTKLQEMEQQLSTYQVMRTETIINTQPDVSIKFGCPPVETKVHRSTDMEVNETRQTNPQELPSETDTLNTSQQPLVSQTHPTHRAQSCDHRQDVDDTFSNYDDENDNHDDNYSDLDDRYISTSYDIDRMASDGKNILYSTYYDDESCRIAYCCVEDDDADEQREWKQSRIDDMIWWDHIKKFICATNNGVYTVEKDHKGFKILCTIRGKWSYIRVASNTQQLFIWMNSEQNNFNGIEIFCTEFHLIRTIDFNTNAIGSFVYKNSSFCATDNLIASLCTREQNNRQVFQVVFCNLDMKKLYSLPLGPCTDYTEIRTDGNNRFFITTGNHRFYIIGFHGPKQTINLQKKGECIAIFDNQRVAVSGQGNSMEVISY